MLFLITFSLLVITLFLVFFHYQKVGSFDFWTMMASLLLFFLILILFRNHQERSSLWNNLKRKPLKKAGLGFFTAFFLYVIFYLGYEIILKLWPEGSEQIRQIYNFKANVSEWRLFILLSFLIGPGEEIVWRWFLQQRWGELIGQKASFLIVTAIYSLVHLPTGNSLLILAAFICGLFWGWLFWQNNSLLLNIVSHSLWDVFIFVLWPLI